MAGVPSQERAGRFVFSGWEGPPLPVYYQLPDNIGPGTPVVFVMHGVNRDADRYRDEWAALARRHGFIAIVPQFAQPLLDRGNHSGLAPHSVARPVISFPIHPNEETT